MRDRLIELLKKGQADYSRRSLEEIKKILYEKHKYNSETDKVLSLWEELADYILEDGWIRPPCKVGDKLYTTYCYGINDWRIEESVVYEIRQRMGTGLEIFERRRSQNGTFSYFKVELDKFGKTVFLIRAEAERALRKVEA